MLLLLLYTGVALMSAIGLTFVARLASLDRPLSPRMRFAFRFLAFSLFVPCAVTNLWLIDTFGNDAMQARLFERNASDPTWYFAFLIPLPAIVCAGLYLLAHSIDRWLELDTPAEI